MNLPPEYVNIRFNTLTEAPTTGSWPLSHYLRFPHEEMEMKGAILFGPHNDGVTWGRAAMEQAKP